MNISKQRNINIELIRVLACVSVVALHTWIGSGIDEVSVNVKGVIRVFEKHGVPLFFMIMGYYAFNRTKTYLQRLKSLLFKVVIPGIIALVLYELFGDWLEGISGIRDCIVYPSVSFVDIIKMLLSGDYGYNPTLWFIYEYVRITLLLPLIALLCDEQKEGVRNIRRVLIILCISGIAVHNVIWLINGVSGNDLILVDWSPIRIHCACVLIGYEISVWIKKGSGLASDGATVNRSAGLKSLCVYLISNIAICAEELLTIKLGLGNSYFYEQSALHYISASAIFIFLMSVPVRNEVVSNVIRYTGRASFGIYLIHYAFTRIISSYNIMAFADGTPHILKYMLTVFLIFSASLLISTVIGIITRGFVGVVCQHRADR